MNNKQQINESLLAKMTEQAIWYALDDLVIDGHIERLAKMTADQNGLNSQQTAQLVENTLKTFTGVYK